MKTQHSPKELTVRIDSIHEAMLSIEKNVLFAYDLIAQIAERLNYSNLFDMRPLRNIDDYLGSADVLLLNTFEVKQAKGSTEMDKIIIEETFAQLGCDEVELGGLLTTPRAQAVKLMAMKYLYENDSEFKANYWRFIMDQCPTTKIGDRYFDFVIDHPRLRTAEHILAIPLGYDVASRAPKNTEIISSLWQDQYNRMQKEHSSTHRPMSTSEVLAWAFKNKDRTR